MAAALFILMALPITLLFAGALLAELPLGEQVPDYLRAMAGAALTRWCWPASGWWSPR